MAFIPLVTGLVMGPDHGARADSTNFRALKERRMASTFHYFRDTLLINPNTIRTLNAPGGATIVFGARSITLSELVSGYSYVIAADELTVPPGAAATIANSDSTTPLSVTVLARKIDGALH